MLDIAIIRERPDWVKEQIEKLNDSAPIDEIYHLDLKRREILQLEEELRHKRNLASKEIGKSIGAKKQLEKRLKTTLEANEDPDSLERELEILNQEIEKAMAKTKEQGDTITALENERKEVENQLNELMLWVPNLPHHSVPIGADDSENIAYEPKGVELPVFKFEPRPHWDIGPELDIIDFERGVKLSGSRFYLLKGWGARLQRSLIQFMLDFHVQVHGYREIYPPFMVRSEMFVGAAQLPKFADNIYRDAEEDFMWLGTAEIALTNIHRDEILAESDLPLNYVSYTPCFRREKFSAGRDVRGIKRGHQFDKVEMYKFTHPDNSYDALEELVQHASDICEALQLPYRRVEMVTGDLGFAAAKKFDLEVWAAGVQEWLEVSSCSNCETFQSRRANIRFRSTNNNQINYVHTLNGSGLALPRVMIALIENNQQSDGSITIPEVLRPYLGGIEKIPA